MNPSELSTIRDVVAPIASRYGVEKMYLFGSRARGDNRPDSDYDFLISIGKLDSLWKFAGFWTALENVLHSSVDVISDDTKDRELLDEAKKEGLLVYDEQRYFDRSKNVEVL